MSNYRVMEEAIGIASDEIERTFDLYNVQVCEMASKLFRECVGPILKDHGLTFHAGYGWGWFVSRDGVTIDLDEEKWAGARSIRIFLDIEVPGFPMNTLAGFIDIEEDE